MVIYRNKPFWSLADSNQGTTPGSESVSCSFWSASYFAKWVGVDGYTTLSCSFVGKITDNDFYGQNGTTYYFVPNENVASYATNSTVSGATLTLAQPITVTAITLGGDIMADSYNSQKTGKIALIVNGSEVDSVSANLPNSGSINITKTNLSINIDSGSLVSVALSLGGARFLDSGGSPDGAIQWEIAYTQ